MKRKHKRLTFVAIALLLLAAASGLVLTAYKDSIAFFFSPTDILEKSPTPEKRLRLGGLVEEGSRTNLGGGTVLFKVTDMARTVPVTYKGILPDLFREGQGIVVEGHYINEIFIADEVFAKHDENYMPPEVAEAIKKSETRKGKKKEISK